MLFTSNLSEEIEKSLNREQKLLLQVALAQNIAEKQKNWQEWKNNYVLDDIWTYQTQRLLPAVYKSISEIEENIELLNKLRGIYSLTWYKNNHILDIFVDVVKYFQEKNIPHLVFKGVSTLITSPENLGIRRMSDLHYLVKENVFEKVCELLVNERGYQEIKQYGSSRLFVIDEHCKIEIHFKLFEEFAFADISEIWNRAKEIEIKSIKTKELDLTDHFLFVFLNSNYLWQKSLFWVNDLIALDKRSDSQIDWHRIIKVIKRRKLKRFMMPAFAILDSNKYFDLPFNLRNEMRLEHFSFFEKIELAEKLFTWENPLLRFSRVYLNYCRIKKEDKFSLTEFLQFLQERSASVSKFEAVKKYAKVSTRLVLKMLYYNFRENKLCRAFILPFFRLAKKILRP